MAAMTIQDAAQRLGISEITVRRKLKSGQLAGQQEEAPNGRWWVEVSDEPNSFDSESKSGVAREPNTPVHDLVQILKDQVSNLQHHLDIREREIGELHVIIQQQTLALPPLAIGERKWWNKLWSNN